MLLEFYVNPFLKIVRKVCKAITVYLGPKYVKLPFTEGEVNDLVKNFHRAHGFPQCLGARTWEGCLEDW